jgi:hypothetical protein
MNKQTNQERHQRRKLILALGATGMVIGGFAPKQWTRPIVNAVVLPAHAQTSTTCVTDSTVGGPLIGNPYGATNCQEACEAEAADLGAALCSVEETVDGSGATQCGCDIDLP